MTHNRASPQTLAVVGYALKKQPIMLGAIVVLSAVTFALLWRIQLPESWASVWDPALSIVTLLAALVVWLSEARREWEQNLTLQLTVRFTHPDSHHPDKHVMLCERAPMLGAEARAFAIALGQQMAIPPGSPAGSKPEHLQYWPVPVKADAPVTERDAGQWVRHLELSFALKAWPASLHANSGARYTVKWDQSNGFGCNAQMTLAECGPAGVAAETNAGPRPQDS